MPRKTNPERPAELIAGIVRYLTRHGLANMSLRPLARSIGTSARVLLYHFGSKERMVVAVLAALRHAQQIELGARPSRGFSADCAVAWAHMTAPRSLPYFRLFFEAYGIAIRRPRKYAAFLRAIVDDWLDLLVPPLRRDGVSAAAARSLATIVLAGLRGFMLDLCATGERPRVDRAVRLWLPSLDAARAAAKGRA
jgi:AcrR family transcriptional regulator